VKIRVDLWLNFLEKFVAAGRRKSEPDWRLHERRVRYPEYLSSCSFVSIRG
jgi:hypothetical protein